jgi:hypothetical protein
MRPSPDTLLRRVKRLNDGSAPPPRLGGIDHWAWRKGRRYGTIVVDLEPGDVVDLLPDRDAKTVKKWLDDHPSVEVISRDRSSSYAQAAAEAAPEARQVAETGSLGDRPPSVGGRVNRLTRSNRAVWNRVPGGVGGEEPRGSPYPDQFPLSCLGRVFLKTVVLAAT